MIRIRIQTKIMMIVMMIMIIVTMTMLIMMTMMIAVNPLHPLHHLLLLLLHPLLLFWPRTCPISQMTPLYFIPHSLFNNP